MYVTDSCVAWVNWFLRNPDVEPTEEMWLMLMRTFQTLGDDMGVRAIFAMSSHPNIVKNLVNCDFATSGRGMTSMWCSVGPNQKNPTQWRME